MTEQWLVALQVAPLIVHQQSAAAVHQPGSPLIASTQVGGVVAWLQTSPPHALPLAMQSVSFVHFAPVPAVEPRSPVALGTLPPPIRLLRRPILLASLSANHRFLSGPDVMPATSVLAVGIGYSETFDRTRKPPEGR